MGNRNSERWLDDELDHGFQRSRRRRPSFFMKLLWRCFWTLAMFAVIYFGYIEIGEQAKSLLLNMAPGQSKAATKQVTGNISDVRDQLNLPSAGSTNLLLQQKEAAWEREFKPSAACRNDASTIECANVYIRARRAFEASYKD